MKTYLTLLLLSCSILAFGQKNNEKLKALKIAHITNEVNLTPDEAEKFWPIYNRFEAKKQELKARENKSRQRAKSKSSFTETEAKTFIKNMLKNENLKLSQRKNFVIELQDILSAKKILQLLEAERSFRFKMINEFKGRMKPRGKR
jgi:hypothetical protein